MKESDFNTRLIKSLQNIGWHALKIPDSYPAPPIKCPECLKEVEVICSACECRFKPESGIRFIPPKPYDIYSFADTMALAIEGKMIKPQGSKKYKAFNFNAITTDQIANLVSASKGIGMGFIALYAWRPGIMSRVTFIYVGEIVFRMKRNQRSIYVDDLEQRLWYDCKKGLFQFPDDLESCLRTQNFLWPIKS